MAAETMADVIINQMARWLIVARVELHDANAVDLSLIEGRFESREIELYSKDARKRAIIMQIMAILEAA